MYLGVAQTVAAFISLATTVAGGGARVPKRPEVCGGLPKPCVRIVAVRAEPATIHRAIEPNTAVATVKVGAYGHLPPGAKATIELSTYDSSPVGNNVRYSPPQTIGLKEGLTIERFKIWASNRTVNGTVAALASIDKVTGGVAFRPIAKSATNPVRLVTRAP